MTNAFSGIVILEKGAQAKNSRVCGWINVSRKGRCKYLPCQPIVPVVD